MNKIELLNGRGQIGAFLKERLKHRIFEIKICVYHTWNIEDKSGEAQSLEYDKFKKFVNNNKYKKIIFISTNSQKETAYVKYKQICESFLIENCENCLILRFPTLIGKGIFYDFKDNSKKPQGEMEIMSIQEACKNIIDNIEYDGYIKIKSFEGHKIKAELIYELVRL